MPSRSYLPGLHCSQITSQSHALIPLVEHSPSRAPLITPSVNLDETTVKRVLTLVSPEFTQNYADRNLQVWDNISVLDNIIPEQISILSSPPGRLPPGAPQ